MKFVSELSASDLVKFMESIHTNGSFGGPLTVDNLTNYLTFVYKIGELLRPVQFDIMALDMDTIHQCAIDCGALKEMPTKGVTEQALAEVYLHNAHSGVFFQRLASYVATKLKDLPQ